MFRSGPISSVINFEFRAGCRPGPDASRLWASPQVPDPSPPWLTDHHPRLEQCPCQYRTSTQCKSFVNNKLYAHLRVRPVPCPSGLQDANNGLRNWHNANDVNSAPKVRRRRRAGARAGHSSKGGESTLYKDKGSRLSGAWRGGSSAGGRAWVTSRTAASPRTRGRCRGWNSRAEAVFAGATNLRHRIGAPDQCLSSGGRKPAR
jgi:hypothetical protein